MKIRAIYCRSNFNREGNNGWHSGMFRLVDDNQLHSWLKENVPDAKDIFNEMKKYIKGAEYKFLAVGMYKPEYYGQTLELEGDWSPSPVYGGLKPFNVYQFKVSGATTVAPVTELEYIGYIGKIPGVSEGLAEIIAKKSNCNMSTLLNMTVNEFADCVTEYDKGRAPTKSNKLRTPYKLAQKIYNYLRHEQARNLIKEKYDFITEEVLDKIIAARQGADEPGKFVPYIMHKIGAISFAMADQMELKDGLPYNSPRRIEAAVRECYKNHCNRYQTTMMLGQDLQTSLEELFVNSMSWPFIKPDAEPSIDDIKVALKRLPELPDGFLYKGVENEIYLYSKANYNMERELAYTIATFAHDEILPESSAAYSAQFQNLKKNNENSSLPLSEKQLEAVEVVGDNYLSIITGGPGRGKTTVLKAIIDCYTKAYPDEQVHLMAPTGLAAKRMSEACGMSATTLHKALNLVPTEDENNYLQTKIEPIQGLIIVDELSMVGISLFAFLAKNTKKWRSNTRMVVVGDVDQLPPIQVGSILKDLIESELFPTTRLDINYRQLAGSNIINIADAINENDITQLNFGDDCTFIEKDHTDEQALLDQIVQLFMANYNKYGLDETIILSPLKRKGSADKETLICADVINQVLRDYVNPFQEGMKRLQLTKREFRAGDRVMNLKNKADIVNGDIGYIIDITEAGNVSVAFDHCIYTYPRAELEDLDLAYAISVHKSQGCQYRSVICPIIPKAKSMLTKQLLYTAVSRAKDNFEFIGHYGQFKASIENLEFEYKRDHLPYRIKLEMERMLKVDAAAAAHLKKVVTA